MRPAPFSADNVLPAHEGAPIKARYRLRVRCHNCRQVTSQQLDVPDVDDAPEDIDELIGSELLAGVRFSCGKCESPIGTVIGVKVVL